MITFKQTGDYSKTYRYLQRILEMINASDFDKYGRKGVKALKELTPVDSGITADSWDYTIEHQKNRVVINFINTNENLGCPIAIILQYGHATRNGGFVYGKDYVNPAIQEVFDQLAKDAWKEVTRV